MAESSEFSQHFYCWKFSPSLCLVRVGHVRQRMRAGEPHHCAKHKRREWMEDVQLLNRVRVHLHGAAVLLFFSILSLFSSLYFIRVNLLAQTGQTNGNGMRCMEEHLHLMMDGDSTPWRHDERHEGHIVFPFGGLGGGGGCKRFGLYILP